MRTVALVASLVAAAGVAACGGGSSDTSGASGGGERGTTSGDEEASEPEDTSGSAQEELARSMQLPAGPDDTVVCTVANGAVRWLLPVPEGFISLAIERRCHVTTRDERVTMMVDAIAAGDAGPERELAVEPDGVRRWALAGFAPDATDVSEGTISIAGETTHWYRMRTTAGDPAAPMEIQLMRRTIAGHHVIVMVALKEGASWTWQDAADWLDGIRPAVD